jgi:hypothetical protein
MPTASSSASIHIPARARRMRQRPHDRPVDISFHACERAVERTSFDPAQVRAMIEHDVAIVLPWTAAAETGARTYHLLYDCGPEDFVVAVVARNIRDRSRLRIMAVLTREQIEPDMGPLPVRHLRRAARRALGPVAFREWERGCADKRIRPPHYCIESFYRCDAMATQEQHRPGRMTFDGAPVCPAFVNAHGLSQVAGHPWFWEWYGRKAADAGLSVDRVVALRVGDAQRAELDVNAPARACPCCEARKPLFAFAH